MTALTDAIQAAGPANVAAVIGNDPSWRVFNLLWNSPEEIIPACEKMGWKTLEDLIAWLHTTTNAVGNAQAFEALIDPPLPGIDYWQLPTIQWRDIDIAMATDFTRREDFFRDHSDASYRAPTKAQWDQIAAACPSMRRKHSGNDVHDCDDFARYAWGWLAHKGLGNLAAGFCSTTAYRSGNMIGGHAVLLVVDSSKKAWAWEPQNGKLYAPKDAIKLGGHLLADEIRLARAYF